MTNTLPENLDALVREAMEEWQVPGLALAVTRDVPCKFNLIPFNPFPESGLFRSKNEQIKRFAQVLIDAGVVTTVRKTRGDDIDAACGQLAGAVKDRTRLAERTGKSKVIEVRAV